MISCPFCEICVATFDFMLESDSLGLRNARYLLVGSTGSSATARKSKIVEGFG